MTTLDDFANLRKPILASSCMSIFRMEQLDSHCTDFHENIKFEYFSNTPQSYVHPYIDPFVNIQSQPCKDTNLDFLHYCFNNVSLIFFVIYPKAIKLTQIYITKNKSSGYKQLSQKTLAKTTM